MGDYLSGYTLFGIAVVLYVLLIIAKYPDRAWGTRPRPDLPTRKGLPILGNTLRVLKNSKPWENLHNLLAVHEAMGEPNSSTMFGAGRVININRPDWIEYVQSTNFSNYVKGDQSHEVLKDLLGDGIFNVDGDTWKYQRKVASRNFSVTNFREIVTPVLQLELDTLEQVLLDHASAGTSFDLQDLYFRFTLSFFVRMAFGTDIGSLSSPDKPHAFAESFDFAQEIASRRFKQPGWKLWQHFSADGRKMKKSIDTINTTIDEIITERQNAPRSRGGPKDLLQLFLDYRHDASDPGASKALTKTELRDVLLNLLLAGRDTTAESLSWTSYRLMENPTAQQRLVEEVHSYDLVDKVSYDAAKSIKFTKAVYQETLRLHPSVPRQGKVALAHDMIPNGGPRIEPGDIVTWSDWVMARSRSIWGVDASRWRPERWLTADGDVRAESQWKFHVFNGGPRLCLGAQLAQFQGLSVLARVFGKFKFEPLVDFSRGDATPAYNVTLTLPMRDPFMVRVTSRE